MDVDSFLYAYNSVNSSLVGIEVNQVYNSIGSNIFIGFGQDLQVALPNGRLRNRKEWKLWVGNASWRITQNGKYLTSSIEERDEIQWGIERLMGKKFQSLKITPPFLDAEFSFERGYKITTFFNWMEENQWIFFLPDETTISVDGATHADIKNAQEMAREIEIIEDHKEICDFLSGLKVIKTMYDENQKPIIFFENEFSLELKGCLWTWRLERDQGYVFGSLDDGDAKYNRILTLVGRTIEKIYVTNEMMDTSFVFSDKYVLKTFSCWGTPTQWRLLSKSEPVFQADIQVVT
ncbi:MAG: hypothetical protein JSR80_06065 [Verrucomicrobia bacterium]|nr:hypothetical protein [Verrucomicrobiota bacterium]